jgi:hypothetical protein
MLPHSHLKPKKAALARGISSGKSNEKGDWDDYVEEEAEGY